MRELTEEFAEQRAEDNLWAYACHLRDLIHRAHDAPPDLLRDMQRQLDHIVATNVIPRALRL